MPLSVLPAGMHELPRDRPVYPRDRPVYSVCQAGGRSAQATELLTSAGVDARSVSGGTAAWTSRGRPSETGTPRAEPSAPHPEGEAPAR